MAIFDRGRVHLWIYNHPFHGISDQVEFFLRTTATQGYAVSVGRNPRMDARNVVIENFADATSRRLIDFCRQTGRRVAVIMTEHVDFVDGRILMHGTPLWQDNDYMHPVTQVARLKNLMDCSPFMRAVFVLGDLPELLNFQDMVPGKPLRYLPFPRIDGNVAWSSAMSAEPRFDVAFTGAITGFRRTLLANVQKQGLAVTRPDRFVSRCVRTQIVRSARVVLNIPQRADWRWLSLMRIIAALQTGRATVSLGTRDDSEIAACCPQIDVSQRDWLDELSFHVANWGTSFQQALARYNAMADAFEKRHPFPHDLFDYLRLLEEPPAASE